MKAAAIIVSDPFDAAADPEMPTLRLALNPALVNEQFRHGLPRLAGENGRVNVRSITVIRHKPGRRCVIEYDVRIQHPDGRVAKGILIGKVRARRFGKEAYRLLDELWKAGFHRKSPDGFMVPEPIAVIPKFKMWLQRKVSGPTATVLLPEPDGVTLACRIADAIHKLHATAIATDRTHTMKDELDILHRCLPTVAQQTPMPANRIERLLKACDRLGAALSPPKACGIHRDFYPAQVIVHRSRLCLIDFDLYCIGDPALDVGNFIGHITEQSLRTFGNPLVLRDREQAMEDRFVELAGEPARPAVRVYTTLTLARHIYLSTQFPERRRLTEQLTHLCEERLQLK